MLNNRNMDARQNEMKQLAKDLNLEYKTSVYVGFPFFVGIVGYSPIRMFGNITDSNLFGIYNGKEIKIYDNSSYLFNSSSTYIFIDGKKIFPCSKAERRILKIHEIANICSLGK